MAGHILAILRAIYAPEGCGARSPGIKHSRDHGAGARGCEREEESSTRSLAGKITDGGHPGDSLRRAKGRPGMRAIDLAESAISRRAGGPPRRFTVGMTRTAVLGGTVREEWSGTSTRRARSGD